MEEKNRSAVTRRPERGCGGDRSITVEGEQTSEWTNSELMILYFRTFITMIERTITWEVTESDGDGFS